MAMDPRDDDQRLNRIEGVAKSLAEYAARQRWLDGDEDEPPTPSTRKRARKAPLPRPRNRPVPPGQDLDPAPLPAVPPARPARRKRKPVPVPRRDDDQLQNRIEGVEQSLKEYQARQRWLGESDEETLMLLS